jgi:putative hemolysin
MSELWAEVALIFLFILGNAFFAAAEIALVSARLAPIAALAKMGDRRASRVAAFQNDPDTFLATVQVGISLTTILAGITGGAVFVSVLSEAIGRLPVAWVRSAASGIAFVSVTAVITYFSMVLGELVPKSIVLKHPERWALRLAGPIAALATIFSPAVRILAASGRLIASALGAGSGERAPFISEEEVRWLLREGHRSGVFDDTERELVAHVFSFASTQVRRAMTARTDVAAIDESWSRDKILEFIATEGYSRYPVFRDNLDTVVGVIHTKDVITILTSGGVVIVEDLIRPPMFVPDSQKLGPLLRSMQRRQEHLAMVLDEFGGTAGVITMEDLLEEIVGEIRDEHDVELPEFSQTGEDQARIAGKMPIDEFNEHFKTGLDESVSDTVAGIVVKTLGRIPVEGDEVDVGDVRFTVTTMTDNRIDWLDGRKLPPRDAGVSPRPANS